ncbi:MAG: hypothetical protein GY851_18300 [bacterium]|nr:hypothetical protein [bacterium]
MSSRFFGVVVLATTAAVAMGPAWGAPPVSKTIQDVLREPLPSEDLSVAQSDTSIVIEGPTFRYTVNKTSGAITGLKATHAGRTDAALSASSDLVFDGVRLSERDGGTTRVVAEGKDQIVIETTGALNAHTPYTLRHIFYNDGVVVTEVTLSPTKDLAIRQGIRYETPATGRFSQYLHKRRDTNGMDCLKGALPGAGEKVDLPTLTSCLEVFGHEAALAAFTDRGGAHRDPADAATASLKVGKAEEDLASVTLTQHIVRIESGGEPLVLPAGEAFTFRVGLAVAPNRAPHPRWRDLRMFIWAGDEKHPYPTDEEIIEVAQLGFTLFQMHRVGTQGEPRPPEGEFERVLKTVHDAGMLFIWTANADLMYASAPKVAELRAAGRWAEWQGFNYGGAYKAGMDPYCSMVATCLASPNGLADYRMECNVRMLEKYAVDGMYIDDNLPYSNCTLWKEHGHPEKVYDCLIELHDVNWRRRQVLKSKCPHTVIIDHCSQGLILPAISAFDCHLFAEGYSFPSLEAYWNTFGTIQNMPAQGCVWPGDTESKRCSAEIAYAFDLLTGGGQYNYLDWRLWPEKMPYAAGVSPEEVMYVKGFNLAQYYFGLYESEPYYFARAKDRFTTTAPNTYATVYHNTTWGEALVVVANMTGKKVETDVVFTEPMIGPFARDGRLAVYDVTGRTATVGKAGKVLKQFAGLSLAKRETRLLYVREVPKKAVYHQWGGKRIAEQWDAKTRTLTLALHGPVGLEDTVVLGARGQAIAKVTVDGEPVAFFIDPEARLAHGRVAFGREPTTLEVVCGDGGSSSLEARPLELDALGMKYRER